MPSVTSTWTKIPGKLLPSTTMTVAGTLWRVAEAHAQYYYDKQVPWYSIETLYDLLVWSLPWLWV